MLSAIPSRCARGTNGHLTEVTQAGTTTYAYGAARAASPQRSGGGNRLASVIHGANTYTFAYNGL